MKVRANKVISISLSILMCMSIVVGTVLALSDLFKVGMSIQVKYDALVNAKVYLSTDSTGARTAGLMQPFSEPGLVVNVNNFKKENSALILNTTKNFENGGAKTKGEFEALGKDSTSLICDPDGEMQFYVYVENFSDTDSVYYKANISFGSTAETTPEMTPFNVINTANYGVSGSTGGGGNLFIISL